MDPTDIQNKIVDAARALLEEGGLAGLRLADIAARAGLDLATLYRHCQSPSAALRLALRQVDSIVLAGGPAETLDPPRDRLFEIMMRRYDALLPWRAALRRMAESPLPDPFAAIGLVLAIERSMAAMLEAAGISSSGLAGALRVRGLCLVHADVLRSFLDDETADLGATMKALDTRLRQAERLAPLLDRFERSPRTAAKPLRDPMPENRAADALPDTPILH